MADGFFTCPSCGTELCSNCKQQHIGLKACSASEPTKISVDDAFNALASREGYALCKRCYMRVELVSGCNHMTCFCGHQFCFECNATWRTCHCEQWSEERLLARAHERAGEHANRPAVVQEHRRRIIAEENCVVHEWDRRAIGHHRGSICGNCDFILWEYCYACTHCRFRVCYTCRHHRL